MQEANALLFFVFIKKKSKMIKKGYKHAQSHSIQLEDYGQQFDTQSEHRFIYLFFFERTHDAENWKWDGC